MEREREARPSGLQLYEEKGGGGDVREEHWRETEAENSPHFSHPLEAPGGCKYPERYG